MSDVAIGLWVMVLILAVIIAIGLLIGTSS
jgi:hypothetical protein